MNLIRLYKRGEGCVIPDGDDYLMVTADGVDADGNWITTAAQSFRSWNELRSALHEMVASGETIVVRASLHFERLARELGLTWMVGEWANGS